MQLSLTTLTMSEGIVIIPTYNEIENIEGIIRAVFSLHKNFHVLIVDDNSPDKTAEKVIELQSEFQDNLFLLEEQHLRVLVVFS